MMATKSPIKTKANEKDNKYDTDLFVYDKKLEKSYRLTDSGANPICSFDKENNLIYKDIQMMKLIASTSQMGLVLEKSSLS